MERSFLDEEKGVSVVLGAILLLGIAVTVIPFWYNHYVKSTMRSKETQQMEEARNQFLEIQSKVSWLDREGEGGTIRLPTGAVSIRFFAGRSPAGTLTVTPGNNYFEVESSMGGGSGGGGSGGGNLAAFRTAATEVKITDPGGSVTTWNLDETIASGGELADIDSDGYLELPYITDNEHLRMRDNEGEVQTIAGPSSGNQPKPYPEFKSHVAVGTWNGSPLSVFYANTNEDNVYRIHDPDNEPIQVFSGDGNGIEAVGVMQKLCLF